MEKKRVEAIDRFSNLPQPVIHHIMYFLPTENAIRVSVLSKKLYSVWRSCPILEFDQLLYCNSMCRLKEKFEGPSSFFDYMDNSIRHRKSNISSIQRFKLCFVKHDKGKIDEIVNSSICLAIERNVRELILDFAEPFFICYCLPKTITPKSIVVLNLSGFEFKFEDLIPGLTLVEDLTLEKCLVSRNFTISSAKLRTLKLWLCEGLDYIAIDAFNLQYFSYSQASFCEINLVHCKSLKSLILHDATITDNWLGDCVSELVLLENLTLKSCGFLKEMKISHQKLKSFQLLDCDKLVKAEIEAPNLMSFHYSGYLGISFPMITLLCSGLNHAKVSLLTRLHSIPQLLAQQLWLAAEPHMFTAEQFMNIKDFLGCFGHCKTLSLISNNRVLIFPKELRECISPLLDLKHLSVELNSLSTSLPELLDSLLWLSPCLETMFITLNHKEKALMLNLQFQNNTAEAEEEDSYFEWPSSWRHHLRKVIIDIVEGDEVKETVVNFFHENGIMVETISNHKASK